jgi:hypothetical protein
MATRCGRSAIALPTHPLGVDFRQVGGEPGHGRQFVLLREAGRVGVGGEAVSSVGVDVGLLSDGGLELHTDVTRIRIIRVMCKKTGIFCHCCVPPLP